MNREFTAWMPYLGPKAPAGTVTPAETARAELAAGFAALKIGRTCQVTEDPSMDQSFELLLQDDGYTVRGGSTGVLYGAYALLGALAAGENMPTGVQTPKYPLRMINCWDNASGSVERGYAGRSLFFEGDKFDYDPDRIRMVARMMAGCGLNVLCINNVNVREPAQRLIEDWLPETAALADILRPFGIRLMLSVDFSRPMKHGVPTADPLDERVAKWWRDRADAVYAAVPDLAGFLVKADSEHRPGPFTYGRSHAEGANMLAKALAPHGGVVVWRCFVYNCGQDWRDTETDRACAAYDVYQPLDGAFDDNVILQIKYGPFDFQVREPVSPLLLAMPGTRKAIEMQLAQEYTGQQIDLFAMAPLWREIFEQMDPDKICAAAAVSNFGRDDNYTGHPFAAVNLFSFGLMAWDPSIAPEKTIRLWARLTYGLDKTQEDTLTQLLMESRDVYELYTASLGLGWMVTPNQHYGPNPCGYEYQAWGTYHKANRNAVGVDRTAAGTGYTEQYPEPLRSLYGNFDSCPDQYKLFFFRLAYDTKMADGRTILQRMYDDRFEGYARAQQMQQKLQTIDLPEPDASVAKERMAMQVANAREWCDIVNTFFYRLSGVPDANGRVIYE